jgi:tRNA pseudouridine13 synthase
MKLKSKPQDFRVHELLVPGYLGRRGRWRVYRVTKKKLTSLEAAKALAELARVPPSEVGLAGLKDRQGITTQYMSVAGGRPARWRSDDLKIEHVGFASGPLTSDCSEGNAFEVTLRNLSDSLMARLPPAVEEVRAHGFVNYFGEQRFGNLRFGQGWIARDLALGEHERALKSLLCGRSEQDDEHHRAFKTLLAKRWGDWRACRDIAGKFGAHHSVFETLIKDPEDTLGALRRVASRLRLIHLYAWQSHVWNRAVARYVASVVPGKEQQNVEALEGRLVFARGELPLDPSMGNSFRLPGPGLADVLHAKQRECLAAVLALEGLQPEEFRIDGIPGFQLKGEDRALVVHPRRLRAMPDERDPRRVTLAFELPRGAYATLLVARLLGRSAEAYGAPRGDGVRPRGARSRGDGERGDGGRRGSQQDGPSGGPRRGRPRDGDAEPRRKPPRADAAPRRGRPRDGAPGAADRGAARPGRARRRIERRRKDG